MSFASFGIMPAPVIKDPIPNSSSLSYIPKVAAGSCYVQGIWNLHKAIFGIHSWLYIYMIYRYIQYIYIGPYRDCRGVGSDDFWYQQTIL